MLTECWQKKLNMEIRDNASGVLQSNVTGPRVGEKGWEGVWERGSASKNKLLIVYTNV